MEEKKAHWSPKMITKTVYDAEGKGHELEPVDAREYIASGHYFSKPPEGVEPEGEAAVKTRAKSKK